MRRTKGKRKGKTKSYFIRLQIKDYLRAREDWVRRCELVSQLQPINEWGAQIGVYNGVLYKMSGKGEIYVPIPNVEVKKVGSKVYYRYKKSINLVSQ